MRSLSTSRLPGKETLSWVNWLSEYNAWSEPLNLSEGRLLCKIGFSLAGLL
ncbi:rCG46075, isoform CRA_a [Rattus norvegicus]|uniref:RCG46075, isoform CRA_a n=1 Tax=Rattus norvegicus TaxID=10116 RepID=A6ICY0_RAT|nr:rCG46075, isoform CRA_a [Rattus norvegicus]